MRKLQLQQHCLFFNNLLSQLTSVIFILELQVLQLSQYRRFRTLSTRNILYDPYLQLLLSISCEEISVRAPYRKQKMHQMENISLQFLPESFHCNCLWKDLFWMPCPSPLTCSTLINPQHATLYCCTWVLITFIFVQDWQACTQV